MSSSGLGLGLPHFARAYGGGNNNLAAPIATSASDYDGTNDYQLRGADLTGIADGKEGTISLWLRMGGSSTTLQFIMGATAATGFRVFRGTTNVLSVAGRNAANTQILVLSASATTLAGSLWTHLLASWDLAAGLGQLYLDDVNALAAGATLTNDIIDYTRGDFAIGATTAGASKLTACLAEEFFHTTYIDLSVLTNRRKFITAYGRPANLGADGSTPLGVQPLIYGPTGDLSGTGNKGSGGAFTTTGALTACSSSP